jgi:transcriptional regulator with XRE-family HTH domain
MSIADLAEKAEVDAGNLSRLERGLIRASADTAERLAVQLGISELEILYPDRYQESDRDGRQ